MSTMDCSNIPTTSKKATEKILSDGEIDEDLSESDDESNIPERKKQKIEEQPQVREKVVKEKPVNAIKQVHSSLHFATHVHELSIQQ